MSTTTQLWLCIGAVYLFAVSDRSYLKDYIRSTRDIIVGILTELAWAFVLVAPAATYGILALRDIFKG